ACNQLGRSLVSPPRGLDASSICPPGEASMQTIQGRMRLSIYLSCLLSLCASSTPAATLLVPQQYPTIQGAVNAANPGDIVKVSAGTYFEQVILKDQVDVRGDGAVLDATH